MWNEIIPNGNFSNGTSGWSSAGYGDMSVEDNVLTYTLLDASNSASRIETYHRIPANHLCYMACDYFCSKETTAYLLIENGNGVRATIPANTWTRVHGISTSGTNVSTQRRFFAYNNSQGQLSNGDVILYRDVILVDLTQMFGSGKEPTAAQFESMFPSHYYPQNEGTLISCGPTAVVSTGFNQWNEQWESGDISYSNGNDTPDSTKIRTKGFISVEPGQYYYFYCGSASDNRGGIRFYDRNKTFLGISAKNGVSTGSNLVVQMPDECYYFRFVVIESTYKNDVCINISDPSRNGTYLPYQKDELDLSWISELTYTPEGASEPVQMFPNGLCSAGTVYDEVTPTKAIKRVASIDMGQMSWSWLSDAREAFMSTTIASKVLASSSPLICQKYTILGLTSDADIRDMSDKTIGSKPNGNVFIKDSSFAGDASSLTTSLQNQYLYYALQTPIEIQLDKTLGYAVQPGGTEQLLPENQPGQTPVTTQIIMDVTYPLDAVGTLQNLPNNYTSLQVMDNFASSLAQALTSAVGATSITRNSNGTWTITITPAS